MIARKPIAAPKRGVVVLDALVVLLWGSQPQSLSVLKVVPPTRVALFAVTGGLGELRIPRARHAV